LALLAVTAPAAHGQEAPTAPTPEELCAAVAATSAYEDCLATARQALETGRPPEGEAPPTGAGADGGAGATVDGKALAEASLEEQERLRWVIGGAALVLLAVVVAFSWRRGMRTVHASVDPEVGRMLEAMVPSEVRAEHPDLQVAHGLTVEEARLLRGQRNLVVGLVALPAVVFVLLQVSPAFEDALGQVGEMWWLPLVLGIPALWWTRRKVARAARAGDERWSVLGLRAESGPEPMLVPRGGGGLRPVAVGDTVLSGVRNGRAVRIELGRGSVRTSVAVPPGSVVAAPTVDGPGSATLVVSGGWLVLERRLPGAELVGADGVMTILRDLQRAEVAADQAQPAGS
jgi:hypothetical protein